MFNGKMKAITFSYDDGVTQDIRFVDILNKYGLKGTFNLNSGYLGQGFNADFGKKVVSYFRVPQEDVAKIYAGHEVAVHTVGHPNLTTLSEQEIIEQVEKDREKLEQLVGYDIVGMAYPCGGTNNNDFVAEVIKSRTKIKYARTITENYSFDLQGNLYRFNPTVFHLNFEKLYQLAEEFLAADYTEPKIFYIWGHSYEFDFDNTWDQFEEFCKFISGKKDIFYGTNKEVLLKPQGV